MASKRAKRRQTAIRAASRQSNGPHRDAATEPAHPAKPTGSPQRTRQPRKTLADSDRLTGEPLRRETPKLVSRDYYPRREGTPTPLKLHVLQDETVPTHAGRLGTFAGGLKWSPAFAEYIGPETTALEAELARADRWKRWWESPYLSARVREGIGLEAYKALRILRSLGNDYLAAVTVTKHSLAYLARQQAIAWRVARRWAATAREATESAATVAAGN